MSEDKYIERRIVTGLITSSQYLEEIADLYKAEYLKSKTARILAGWCWQYWKKYRKAPGAHIQDVYWRKLQDGLDQDTAEWIEEVLNDLSEDFDPGQFNIQYLRDETCSYFKQQALLELSDSVKDLLDHGDLLEAEELVSAFNTPEVLTGSAVYPLEAEPEKYRRAFELVSHPLISFPGDLGVFINDQLIQGAFVGFVGPDKVGKSFFMLELAMRAIVQGSNVALFEVGDMTEEDMLCRIGIYLTKRSDMPTYCGDLYIPVVDCVHNQLGLCGRRIKNPNGIFTKEDFKEIWKKEYEAYIEVLKEESQYRHCHFCSTHPEVQDQLRFKGALWYQKRDPVPVLTWQDAVQAAEKFRKRHRRELSLFTYPSGELRPKDVRAELNLLNKKKGYIPKVVLIDYPDVMEADNQRLDQRGKTNQIWQAGRRISQEYQCLVVYVTQCDARGYDRTLLDRSNFSESKMKNAHVTAMFGMNQTDEERVKGILRLNKILVRRGHYDSRQVVHVLQRLQIGRPFLGSFF